jgi:prephenate dehydratase
LTESYGYLGPGGTFGEQAALLNDPAARLVAFPTHAAIIDAVAEGVIDAGIVAVENGLEGAINETLDRLIRAEAVFIRGELVLPIEHHLIAAPDTSLDEVAVVMSHPQALGQCRAFLESTLAHARLEAALSTAAAVEEALRTRGAAAIGTRRAAELMGGAILAERVQDVAVNKTRFLIVGRQDSDPTGDDKTSIAFTVAHDRPGTLIGALQELSTRSINLTRIESRPSREDIGIYVFLIDFQGHRSEATVAGALAAVESRASYFRLFGSYPRFVESP